MRAAVQNAVRDAIGDGRLRAGDRLPSSRTLASDLGVARGTVVEAYEQLLAEGWLVTRQGQGTRVADVPDAVPRSRDSSKPGCSTGTSAGCAASTANAATC